MVDLGPLNIDKPSIPTVPIANYLPGISASKREPLVMNLPRAVTGYSRKYAQGGLIDQLALQYPQEAIRALQDLDAQRAAKGQSPLNEDQTRKALDTVVEGKPATPAPKKGFLNVVGNSISNIGDIVRSIPRLPVAVGKEVKEMGPDIALKTLLPGVPSLPFAIYRGITSGKLNSKNPAKALEQFAQLPGINFLPGSYIASNITHPGDLIRNPVFTALDALPFVNKAAQGSRVGRTTAEAADAIRTGDLMATVQDANRINKLSTRPIKNTLLNRLDETGVPVRTGLGEIVDQVAQTRPFRAFAQTSGGQARDAMFAMSLAQQRIRGVMSGELPTRGVDDELGRMAVQAQKQFDEAGFEGRSAEFYDRLTNSQYDGLSPEEMGGVELARDWADKMGEYLVSQDQLIKHGGEYYDLTEGLSLRRKAKMVETLRPGNQLRAQVLTGTADPNTALADLLQAIESPRGRERVPGVKVSATEKLQDLEAVTRRQLDTRAKATFQAMRNSGYDTAALEEAWKQYKGARRTKAGTIAQDTTVLPQLIRDALSGKTPLAQNAVMTFDEALETLKGRTNNAKDGQRVRQLLNSIADGEWKTVTRQIDGLMRLKDPLPENLQNALREIRNTGRLLERDLKGFSDEALTKAQKALSDAEAAAVPARFLPLVSARARDKFIETLIPITDEASAQRLINETDTVRLSSIPGFDEKHWRKIERETARTWKAMRDEEGLDPVFVHTVSPGKSQVLNPVQSVIPKDPSSIKKRTMDLSPATKNVAVAMTDQAMEVLSRKYVELGLKDIVDQMGVSEARLREIYTPAAKRRAATHPALDFDGHLQRLIGENYRRFDPDVEGYTWGSPMLKKIRDDKPFIPINTYKNLKMLADPKSVLGGAFDPITSTFRIATTSLSIRTQIYNMIGGAIMTSIEQPNALISSGRKALRYMRDPDSIPPQLRELMGSQKHTLMDLDKEALGVVNEGVYAFLKGKTLNRYWDEAQRAKVPGRKITGRFGGAVKGLVEKSYSLNGAFDDFYRMSTYIDAYETAIKKGTTPVNAERIAVGQIRKVMQDWMGMTPIERSVMKSIFPFYGFIGHALKFVARYPFDHPLRAEVFSKVALAELEDQEALPSRFLSYLFFGGSGPEGQRTGINLGPLNPFGDVANYMTIQGALGATNPVIQTALQMAGVEQGEASLYPSLRYDPETGRMGIRSPNPLQALLENTIPQSALLTSVLGMNAEYNDMARRDPAAAARFIASGLTLPIPWRQYNVPQEEIKAELARQEAEQKVLQEAVRSGDWSEASKYPALAEYLRALDSLPDQSLQPFQAITADQIKQLPSANQYQGVAPLSDQVAALTSRLSATIPQVSYPGAKADAGITAHVTRGGI
jgi:hypothetical protein